MTGETYAFSDAFDQAFVIRHDLETIYNRIIPFVSFTDSKKLFDFVTKVTYPTEKRLMIDIASVRQVYDTFKISNIGLVEGKNNSAD